jgi:broad specificity phosphatase PhoE
MRKLLCLTVLFLAAPTPAQEAKTYPAHVLIIRHAEKPAGASANLSPKGQERARALHHLFKKSDGRPPALPKPDFIFATKDSKSSRRPGETVAPLAKHLGLKVNEKYANGDFAKLAHALLHDPQYAGKTVLICWHHGTIPQLAPKLGAADAPRNWKSSAFDRVWQND